MFHAICSSKLQLQMVRLSCNKGSGHGEKATWTAQTCLSLKAALSLKGTWGLTAPVVGQYMKAWLKLYAYRLEWFCPVFYCKTYFAIPLPQAIFSIFFSQLFFCLHSAHIVQWHFRVEMPDTVLANRDKRVPSVGSEKYKVTAGAVCRGDKAGEDTHSDCWFSLDHLVEQNPLS